MLTEPDFAGFYGTGCVEARLKTTGLKSYTEKSTHL